MRKQKRKVKVPRTQRAIAAEFEREFLPTPLGRNLFFRQTILPDSVVEALVPAWKDKASWRYVFLKSPLWKQLPLELYQKIEACCVKKGYKCVKCGVLLQEKHDNCNCEWCFKRTINGSQIHDALGFY